MTIPTVLPNRQLVLDAALGNSPQAATILLVDNDAGVRRFAQLVVSGSK